jgi:hypothetical protein
MASFSFALNRWNLTNAGENAATMFLEFFAARIRNQNTRGLTPELLLNFWRGRRITSMKSGRLLPCTVAAHIKNIPVRSLVIRLRIRPKQQELPTSKNSY